MRYTSWGRLYFAVHGEQRLDGNTEEALIFLEVGEDELPVGIGQGHDFAAVQLFVHHLLVGIPDENRPAGGQGKEVRAGIGAGLDLDPSPVIELHAVDDDKTAAVHGVAGHEGFGQEVQGRAVDHHPGAAHGVDEGRPAAFPMM